MPRAEMETFNRNLSKYWNFMKSFDATVSPKKRRLMQSCEGKAVKAIAPFNLMDTERGYTRVQYKLCMEALGIPYT